MAGNSFDSLKTSPQIEQRAWALKKMPLLADVRKEGEVHEAARC
jgi:hypothetical protein